MPDSGTIDTSIYKDAVSDSPFDFQNKLLANQKNQQDVQEGNIKLATHRFGLINNAASGLLQDPDLGKKDIKSKLWDTLARATAGDAMTAQHAVQFAQQFPTDPAQQAQVIKGVYAQTLDAWQKGRAYLGETQASDTGPGVQLTGQGAFGGPLQDRGYIEKGLPPTTELTQPDLSKNYAGSPGRPGIYQPGASQPNTLQPPQAIPQIPLAPPTQSRAPVQQRVPAQPSGPAVAAPPPGAAAAKEATGKISGVDLGAERQLAANYRGSVNSLEKAIPALENLGTTGTGPGTETVNHLKSFLVSNVPGFAKAFAGAKDEVEQYDIAKKYLVDFVNQNGNSGTNDKLAAAFAGNPSVNISNAAASDVAKTALSLRKMRQAQLEAFQETGLSEDQFGKWASTWNRQQDPRVYAWDYMNDAQKKTTLQSLSGAKRDHFIMAIHDAADKDFINPESLKPSKK